MNGEEKKINKRAKKSPRFPDYERVDTGETITFGTTVFIRKDRQALIVVFPAGQSLHFTPMHDVAALHISEE